MFSSQVNSKSEFIFQSALSFHKKGNLRKAEELYKKLIKQNLTDFRVF